MSTTGASVPCPSCGEEDWSATVSDETVYMYHYDAATGVWVDESEDLTAHTVSTEYSCDACGELFEALDPAVSGLPDIE